MIYKSKIPATDNDLSRLLLESGCRKIREPRSLFLAVILSIPFMFLNVAIMLCLISPVRERLVVLADRFSTVGIVFAVDIKLTVYILMSFLFIIIHELLHAILIPDFLKSQKTFWGITLFGGFVSTTEEISKSRFVMLSVLPYITLSLIMPLILNAFNILKGFAVFLSFLNASASSVDMLNVLLIITQVPIGSRIICNGHETYYRQYN